MTDIFISYSRRDNVFARRLVDALKQAGRDSWVDWEGIPYSVDWWREICAAIDAADSFVLIITPDALASPVCNQEIEYARSNNKRIVPVMHRTIDEREMAGKWFEQTWEQAARTNWTEVKKLNWLFFRDEDDFDKAFASLIETIAQDPEHAREHTRLLVRAREWDADQRDASLLLRGNELREAEAWITSGASKQPQPTALHGEYLRASIEARSEEEERARQQRDRLRWLVGLLAVLLVGAIGASALAVNQSQLADANAVTATIAQGAAEFSAATAVANAAEATIAQGAAQISANDAETQAARADANAATSDANFRQALETQLRFLADLARQQAERGDTRIALDLAMQGMAYYPDTYYPENVRALNQALALTAIERFRLTSDYTVWVDLNADGSLMLTRTNSEWSVYDTETGERRLRGIEPGEIAAAIWSPDETLIATLNRDDRAVRVYDANTNALLRYMQHPRDMEALTLAFDANGKTILVGLQDRPNTVSLMALWDAQTGASRGDFAAVSRISMLLNKDKTAFLVVSEAVSTLR